MSVVAYNQYQSADMTSYRSNVPQQVDPLAQLNNLERELDLIRQLCAFEAKLWDRPFKALPNQAKRKFKLALTLAFDFDLYLLDPMALASLRRQGGWSEAWQVILEQRLRERAVIAIGGDRFGIAECCTHSLVFGRGELLVKGRTENCEDQIQIALRLRSDKRKHIQP